MNGWLTYLITCVIAYLLGCISTGTIVSRLMHGPDLRSVGSKNTGATNVQRTMGWGPGLITFAGDVVKALLACWIGHKLIGPDYGALWGGLWVIIGHNWPVFYKFSGGKGVASSCGVMLFCFPVPALICFAVAVLIILITKYVSLGSLSLITLYAILVSAWSAGGNLWIILWAVFLAVLCIIRHRANIIRLIHGTENKLGQKVKA